MSDQVMAQWQIEREAREAEERKGTPVSGCTPVTLRRRWGMSLPWSQPGTKADPRTLSTRAGTAFT